MSIAIFFFYSFRPATTADVIQFQVRFSIHTKKRGASSLPGPRSEGSRIALIIKPSNAESPTPMYVIDTLYMCTDTTPP